MTHDELDKNARLLAAYDEQLRTDAETPSAITVTRYGPLRLVTFMGGRGFVTYQNLDPADGDIIRRLVPEALTYYQADPEINRVEWKTRGHDNAPGLHEALLEHGFIPDETESIMIGEAMARQNAPGRHSAKEKRSSTVTRPSIHVRSSNAPAFSKSQRRRPTSGRDERSG